MLTKKKLIELGFIEREKEGRLYFQKGEFYLFPSGVGCWQGGYNYGEFAVVENGILICDENQLNEALKNAS